MSFCMVSRSEKCGRIRLINMKLFEISAGPVGDRVHQCKMCTRHFSTIDKLREHRAEEHPFHYSYWFFVIGPNGELQHMATTCLECGKIFTKSVDIRRHTSNEYARNWELMPSQSKWNANLAMMSKALETNAPRIR